MHRNKPSNWIKVKVPSSTFAAAAAATNDADDAFSFLEGESGGSVEKRLPLPLAKQQQPNAKGKTPLSEAEEEGEDGNDEFKFYFVNTVTGDTQWDR